MTQFITCDYCRQQNHIDALCCEFCGAPVIMTELKVRQSIFIPEEFPRISIACSTSVVDYPYSEYSTTGSAPSPDIEYIREIGRQAGKEVAGRELSEASPVKRGWRGWLGL